jgi:hypothetical protein
MVTFLKVTNKRTLTILLIGILWNKGENCDF